MKREMTCIVCPMGCSLKIELTVDGQILSVEGNNCKRGAKYAKEECTNPQRTVTTTLRCENGQMVAVKTKNTIPKEKQMEAMDLINQVVVKTPVRVGDILIEDVFGSPVVAVQNRG